MLCVRDLLKTRGEGSARFEVRLPELTLGRGEFCALVGASGSGKSTLLDVLGLVLAPSALGRFELGRRDDRGGGASDVTRLWARGDDDALATLRRERMGYVLQSGGLFPFLSVGENIELPRRLCRLPLAPRDTARALARFGLVFDRDKRVSELSGGERQRVAILRALAHRPPLVLADEPTAAVDGARARAIVALLREYAIERGAAVLMVTHDLSLLGEAPTRTLHLLPERADVAGAVRYVARADDAR